jgi:hypothetical protein
MTVKPSVKIAIQYEPRSRGIRLALAYCRIRRGSGPFFDLYGYCIGYEGGGVYEDWPFHVGEQIGVGFINYTPANEGCGWADDCIGVSGLAGQEFAAGVESLLNFVQDRLMTRWCCYTDEGEGDPDLTPAAKRRLNCERRKVFYTSPDFNEELLAFLSPEWGISVTFGEAADEWDRAFSEVRKRKRAKRNGFIAALVKYPQLIENGLRLLSNEAIGRCGRNKLVFAADQGGELVVACQWEPITERDGERITTLKRDLLSSEHGNTRLMVVALGIDPAVRQVLDREGISCRWIGWGELCRFLDEHGERKLSEVFKTRNIP